MVRNYKRKTTRVYTRDGFYSAAAKAARKLNPKPRGRPRKELVAPTDTAVREWEASRPPLAVLHYFPGFFKH